MGFLDTFRGRGRAPAPVEDAPSAPPAAAPADPAAAAPGADRPACPSCGGPAAPVVYGTPHPGMQPLFLDGRIVAGGGFERLLREPGAHWRCRACGHSWRGGIYAGGDGSSVARAVQLRGVDGTAVGSRLEKQFISERLQLLPVEYSDPASGWVLAGQALIHDPGGRAIDMIRARHPGGAETVFYFDVSGFAGRHP
jgi:hypothetical protein